MTPTFWIALGFTAILMVWMLASIIAGFREAEAKEKAAYILGYNTMKAALNAPYCGPDMGYDGEVVLYSFNAILSTLTGDDYQKNSSIRGMRDAITEYEREFGAP